MATWDLVQQAEGTNSPTGGTIVTATFGTPATAGNYIIAVILSELSTGADVANFTLANLMTNANDLTTAIEYKVAAGGETAISYTPTGASPVGMLAICEFVATAGKTIAVDVIADGTSDTATPGIVGAGTTVAANTLAVAGWNADHRNSGFTPAGFGWTDSFTARGDAGWDNFMGAWATRVIAGAATAFATSISWTGGAQDGTAPAVAVFYEVSAPTPLPVVKTDIGNAANTTGDGSTVVTTTATAEVGSLILVRFAIDNSGTSGAAPAITSVVDSASNTYTQRGATALADPGVASAGVAGFLYTAPVTTQLASGGTITITYTPNPTAAKAIQVEKWVGLNTANPYTITAAAMTGTTPGTAPVGAITPTAVGQLVYAHLVTEGPAADAFSLDADTTDGTWVLLTTKASAHATAATNVMTRGQYKIVSGVTAQAWASTITSRDFAGVIYCFNAAALPAGPPVYPQILAR